MSRGAATAASGLPATVGRYRIVAELGRGGMGVVYRAQDPVIDRPVALKTIRNVEGLAPEAYEQLRERFLREARAAGRLSHPGIVSVLDAGTDPASGVSYIAMELVDGGDLEGEIRAGKRFSFEEAVEVTAAAAEALDHAHALGIVHRDVKPANVLRDRQGRLKITDFGIARLAESGLTQAGQVLGSPAYMSPEQIAGAPVDARSDVFSLGVVLYQLLTGERPFGGESLTSLSYQIVHREPVPARSVNPALPAACEAVVRRALAKSPEDRYPSAGALAADLRALLAGAPLAPDPLSGATPRPSTGTVVGTALPVTRTIGPRPVAPAPAAPARGRRPVLPLLGALVAVSLAGLGGYWLARRGDPTPPAEAGARPAGRPTPRPTPRPTAPPAAAAPARPAPTPTAESGQARLRVDLEHFLSSGTARLLVDGEEAWSVDLKARKRTRLSVPGWDGGPKLRLSEEAIRQDLLVPAGSRTLTVSVVGSGFSDSDAVRVRLGTDHTHLLKVRMSRITRKLEVSLDR